MIKRAILHIPFSFDGEMYNRFIVVRGDNVDLNIYLDIHGVLQEDCDDLQEPSVFCGQLESIGLRVDIDQEKKFLLVSKETWLLDSPIRYSLESKNSEKVFALLRTLSKINNILSEANIYGFYMSKFSQVEKIFTIYAKEPIELNRVSDGLYCDAKRSEYLFKFTNNKASIHLEVNNEKTK